MGLRPPPCEWTTKESACSTSLPLPHEKFHFRCTNPSKYWQWTSMVPNVAYWWLPSIGQVRKRCQLRSIRNFRMFLNVRPPTHVANHSWWYQYSSWSNQQRTYHPFQLDSRSVLPRSTCRVNHPSEWTYSWCRRPLDSNVRCDQCVLKNLSCLIMHSLWSTSIYESCMVSLSASFVVDNGKIFFLHCIPGLE